MPQASKPGVDWNAVRQGFEEGASYRQLAKSHDVSHVAISKRARREGWVPSAQAWKPLCEKTDTARLVADPQTPGERRIVTYGLRTPESMAEFLVHIERGASQRVASMAIGIDDETAAAWRKADPEFDRLIRQARGNFLSRQSKYIATAGKRGAWQASARLLETAPETREDWAQKSTGGGVNIVFSFARDAEGPVIEGTAEE